MKKTGFTLIETLIAITILILAITGPLVIAGTALHSAYYATDQVTAFYLAEEGIEYVRYWRDNNTLAGNGQAWNNGFDTCATGCGIDAYDIASGGSNNIATCSDINSCPVSVDSSGYFRQSNNPGIGWLPTNFHRLITISPVNDHEVKVTSKVIWQTGSLSSTFQLDETLFNTNASQQNP